MFILPDLELCQAGHGLGWVGHGSGRVGLGRAGSGTSRARVGLGRAGSGTSRARVGLGRAGSGWVGHGSDLVLFLCFRYIQSHSNPGSFVWHGFGISIARRQ